MNGGVYSITAETPLGPLLYIGSSAEVDVAWDEDRQLLEAGKHPSRLLQAAYRAAGPEGVTWRLVERCYGHSHGRRRQVYVSALQPRLNSEAERRVRTKPKPRFTPNVGDNPQRLAGQVEAMSDPTIQKGRRLAAAAKAAEKRGDHAEAKRLSDERIALISEYHHQKIQEALALGNKPKASRHKNQLRKLTS